MGSQDRDRFQRSRPGCPSPAEAGSADAIGRPESEATPSQDAFLSSGSSPTLSLLGCGKVGRALLRHPALAGFRLQSVSDRSGTLCDLDGLSGPGVAALKSERGCLEGDARARSLSSRLALDLVRSGLVADCMDTDLSAPEEALARSLEILDRGQFLASCAKAALLASPEELLAEGRRERFGANAVLGGTGRALLQELEGLRRGCDSIVAVPNATTSCLIEVLELGGGREEALEVAARRGVLEADPAQDLDGRDAALKLAIVARAVFGIRLDWTELPRPHFEDLDPELLQHRYRRGFTTRLVVRADREGWVSLAYEELPRGYTLAIPSQRVLYAYEHRTGSRRLHLGDGVGAEATARALLVDLEAFAGRLGQGGRR